MFNSIPEFIPVNAGVNEATWSAALTITVPPGANGILVQAITQNVYLEFGGGPVTANSLQIFAGQNPLIMRLSSGRTLTLNKVTAGAILYYRFVNILDR